MEIGTKERTGSSIPATMLTGGEGKEGEEQEEVELYPLVGSDGVGGGRRGALHGSRGATAVVSGGGGRPAMEGERVRPGSTSATRRTRSGAWLGRGMARGEGAAVSFRWRPWWLRWRALIVAVAAWRRWRREQGRWRGGMRLGVGEDARHAWGAGGAVGNLSTALLGLVCVCGCFGRGKELAANKLVQRNLA